MMGRAFSPHLFPTRDPGALPQTGMGCAFGAQSVSGKSVGLFIGQALEHEPTHANVDMGFGVTDSFFIVAGQSSALVQPTESALDNPSLFDELKALGPVAAADDVEVELAEGTQPFDPGDQGTAIAAICPDDLQSAKEQVEARKEGDGPVPVLHGGGSHADTQNQAKGIDQEVSLAPADLLAGIVANRRAALLGSLDALTVEDGRRRRGLASFGEGLRPSATRTLSRKHSLSLSQRPLLRQAEK